MCVQGSDGACAGPGQGTGVANVLREGSTIISSGRDLSMPIDDDSMLIDAAAGSMLIGRCWWMLVDVA